MKAKTTQLLAVTSVLALGCARLDTALSSGLRGLPTADVPVRVRSNNRSDVDVYLLCGDRDARWLGVVRSKEVVMLSIPAERTRCGAGLTFFLVPRDVHRGYWAGPVYPLAGEPVDLLVEKYAGLSTARLRRGAPRATAPPIAPPPT